MALVAAEVRLPPSGQRVEVDALGLLVAVAAALPREHRSPAADLARRRARLADPPVAVHEQPPRDLRQPEVEEGIDVELVPEDVPAIGLAVETARRDAGVVMRGEARADLQDVRDVQPQQELGAFVARKADVADLPELLPRPRVTGEGLVERGIARDALDRVRQRLVDRAIPRRVQGRQLLHAHRLALLHVELEDLLDVVLGLDGVAGDGELLRPAIDAGPRRHRHLDARMTGSRLQRDDVRTGDPGALRIEVTSLELPVAGDALVEDPPVERRDDLDRARPVLGREVPGERRLVHAVHADEAPALQPRLRGPFDPGSAARG